MSDSEPNPWAHIPKQYAGRWACGYDVKRSVFFVHCGGHRILDAEDSEVCNAVCRAYNEQRNSRIHALVCKALRECQLALCPEWGDCADLLKDGEKCACGFEGGPYANAVPKNRAAAEIERLRAEIARLQGGKP